MGVAIPLSLILLLSVQAAAAQSAGPPLSPDAQIDAVTVEAPKTPLEKAVTGFVKSNAAPSIKIGKIHKWASGICPTAMGLTAELNLGVTALLKQVAAQVGAPVETKEPCTPNVTIIFTRTPQAVLDDMAKNHEDLLGYHDVAQTKQVATVKYPVQAWYATATRDNNGILVPDNAKQSGFCAMVGINDLYSPGGMMTISPRTHIPIITEAGVESYVQRQYMYCGGARVTGNRLNDGLRSELDNVTIVVDFNKLDGLTITPVANYIAMLALSQTQAFETCEPLASITNLMTPGCDASLKPKTLSPNDIAYLKAFYKANTDIMLQGQQSDSAHQMETALGAH